MPCENFRIEVVCVGSELLHDRVNTDVNIISGIIARTGFSISRCSIVGDDISEIMDIVGSALTRSDIVFVTGGLGPTSDDITRESIARLLNRKLLFSEAVWQVINNRFKKRGIKKIPSINRRQAYVIEGAEVIENLKGTAPGLIIREGKKTIVLLPGPPAELVPMAERFVSSIRNRTPLHLIRFGMAGLSESVVEERINPFFLKNKIKYTILASPYMIEILITETITKTHLQDIEDFLKYNFGDSCLGLNPPALPEILGEILRKRKLKLVIAESCTGGLAGKLLTDIPGSSDFFNGSLVLYNNLLKKRILKIPKTILKKYGAVSNETALYMAKGALKVGKSDISISFTGIAGPSGGSEDKPVGLVYIGVGLLKKKFKTYRFVFPGTREQIRERAVYQGFDILRRLFYEK